MFKLQTPIQDAIRDPKVLTKFFEEWKLMPYAGSGQKTSHGARKLFIDLNRLSPSASTCKSDIKTFAFDGDLDIVQRTEPGLKSERGEVSQADKTRYVESLKSVGLDLITIRKLTARGYDHYVDTGDKLIYAKVVRVNNVSRVYLEAVHPLQWMWLVTEPDEPNVAVITDTWDAKKWREKPPKLIRAFPEWSNNARGVYETVFHFMADNDDSDWYGKPDDMANMFFKFNEFQEGNLHSKITSTEIVSKGILALEAPPPEEDEDDTDETKDFEFKQKVNAIRSVMTQKGLHGEAESLAIIEYLNGGKVPSWIPMEVNRDAKYHGFVLDTATSEIYAGFHWAKELTGFTKTNSGIGSDILINLFVVKNETVIKKIQQRASHENDIVLNGIFDFIGGYEHMKSMSIQFPDMISELVEKLGSNGNTNNPIGLRSQEAI